MSADPAGRESFPSAPADAFAEPRHVLLVSRRDVPPALLERMLGATATTPLVIDRVDTIAEVPAILAEDAHDVLVVDARLGGRDLERLVQAAARADRHPPLLILPESADLGPAHAPALARDGDARPRDLVEEVFRHSLETSVTRRALRASEARFETLAEACAQGVLVLDAEGIVRVFNPAAERLLGARAEDRIGRDGASALPGLQRASGEPFADDAHPLRLARWRTWSFVEALVRVARPDGADAVLTMRVQRIAGTDPGTGRPLLVLLGDATPIPVSLAPAESPSRSAVSSLPAGARGPDVRSAGALAHDLNNLLQTIQGYAELMASGLAPHDPGRAHLDPLREAIERSARLVRSLRGASSPPPLSPRALDLDGFLSGLRPLLEYLLGPTVHLETELGLDPALLMVDPVALEQSVMNLALNARDAMPEGGRLRLATAEVRLDPTVARTLPGGRPGRFARLTVEDDGCGMDEETRRRAFEPFYTTKPKDRGSGLGLAAVHGFVDRSGGFVLLETAPGRGCRVDLYLPRDGR